MWKRSCCVPEFEISVSVFAAEVTASEIVVRWRGLSYISGGRIWMLEAAVQLRDVTALTLVPVVAPESASLSAFPFLPRHLPAVASIHALPTWPPPPLSLYLLSLAPSLSLLSTAL